MAIAYARVTFPHLLPDTGAVALYAYLGRRNVRDPRTGRIYDFEKLSGDLVCEVVRLPADSPSEFRDPTYLATAIDMAEMRRLQTLSARQRWPQLGASFVVALPPDWELTLDGVLELADRLVQIILAGRPIPTLAVVHDPNRVRSGDCNRHLHVEMAPRRIGPTGLFVKKERALLAQVRTGNGIYLAEKITWPTVHAELQNYLFAECGLDLAVDPPLPCGRRHWPRSVYRDEQDMVAEHDRMIDDQNFALVIGGHPTELVDRMRRGRSTVSVGEIRSLVSRYGLTNDAVEDRLEEILGDPEVLTFARSKSETRPARVTLRALGNLIERATTAIDSAALVPD